MVYRNNSKNAYVEVVKALDEVKDDPDIEVPEPEPEWCLYAFTGRSDGVSVDVAQGSCDHINAVRELHEHPKFGEQNDMPEFFIARRINKNNAFELIVLKTLIAHLNIRVAAYVVPCTLANGDEISITFRRYHGIDIQTFERYLNIISTLCGTL